MNIMKDLYLTLPPFAPDYGGACETMYELGGLVLICDASGCTVNYVSFDEPRWHTRPGNVFCSGLTEIEAVMGDDEAVIQKALKAAEILKPNFIAYVGSSVPMIVGTDFEGIARETEERSGIPSFGFDCNGIRSYVEGASEVLLSLVKRFALPDKKSLKKQTLSQNQISSQLQTLSQDQDPLQKTRKKDSVEEGDSGKDFIFGSSPENLGGTVLLGLLPLDDASLEASERIRGLFPDLQSSLSFHCSLEDLRNVRYAKQLVVVSRSGLKAAEYLSETYHIPYTVGLPLESCDGLHKSTLVIGEDVRAYSLAKALGNADALDLFSKDGLSRYHTADEEEIRAIVSRYDNVIGDPVFKPFVKGNFVPLPTVSVSGGIFKETVNALDTKAIEERLV
ncbi:MAG: hypothetical protein IJL98_03225 [Lachnospiraceae bacterium]|nr:hypothetical protein [Lachnospiraceae bacterium]